jgi:tartrate dehydrogenase/decarboxylase/D-malate dehydrogenase
MMLQHLGEDAAAAAVVQAFENVLARGGEALTPDLGGSGSTELLGKTIADEIRTVAANG